MPTTDLVTGPSCMAILHDFDRRCLLWVRSGSRAAPYPRPLFPFRLKRTFADTTPTSARGQKGTPDKLTQGQAAINTQHIFLLYQARASADNRGIGCTCVYWTTSAIQSMDRRYAFRPTLQ
jgi:hypothetical protein